MKPSHYWASLFLLLLALALPVAGQQRAEALGDALTRAIEDRALRRGDTGAAVAELQRLLQERGFNPGPVDGVFGPLTEGAVRRAQRHHGLVVDGLAGRKTVGALRSAGPAGPGPESGAVDENGLVFFHAEAVPASTAAHRTAPADRLAQAAPAPAPTPVALTFNGLPDEGVLRDLLEELKRSGHTATFFVYGEEAKARPDLLCAIVEAGHELGNLGYKNMDMRRITDVTARALIRRTQEAIASATGEEPAWFRPPQGRFNHALQRLVEEEGLELTLWSNVAVRPVPERPPESTAEEMVRRLYGGAVLMLPLDRPEGVAAVRPLLDELDAAGYRSVTLSNLRANQGES